MVKVLIYTVVHFFNTMLIRHLWQLKDSCFPALVSNMCCSITLICQTRPKIITGDKRSSLFCCSIRSKKERNFITLKNCGLMKKLMLVDKDKELLEKYCVFARAGERTGELFVNSLTLFHCTKTSQVEKR